MFLIPKEIKFQLWDFMRQVMDGLHATTHALELELELDTRSTVLMLAVKQRKIPEVQISTSDLEVPVLVLCLMTNVLAVNSAKLDYIMYLTREIPFPGLSTVTTTSFPSTKISSPFIPSLLQDIITFC
jgi:hypothetical protein